jgi:hypothetical protein
MHTTSLTIITCYYYYLLRLQHKARHPHEPPQRPQIVTVITGVLFCLYYYYSTRRGTRTNCRSDRRLLSPWTTSTCPAAETTVGLAPRSALPPTHTHIQTHTYTQAHTATQQVCVRAHTFGHILSCFIASLPTVFLAIFLAIFSCYFFFDCFHAYISMPTPTPGLSSSSPPRKTLPSCYS